MEATMEMDVNARAGRRAALKTLPMALLMAAALCMFMVGPEGFFIISAFGLLGLPGLLPLAWYLGAWGGTRVLQNGGDATVTGFLVSAGSLLGASVLGSTFYAIFTIAREGKFIAGDLANQYFGPLYFLTVFGLPACVILGLLIGWFLRREAGRERVPFRPWRALLLAAIVFPGAPATAIFLVEAARRI